MKEIVETISQDNQITDQRQNVAEDQTLPGWQEELQLHRSKLLNHLLVTGAILGLIAILSVYASLPEGLSTPSGWMTLAPFLTGWSIVLVLLGWRSLDYRYRALTFTLLTYVLSCIIFARGGLPGSGRVWILLLPALAFVLLGPRFGIAAGALSIATYVFFAIAINQKWVVPQVSADLTSVAPLRDEGTSFLISAVVLTMILRSFHHTWTKAVAKVNEVNRKLQEQTRRLEETNEELHHHTSQLQTTTEITQAVSSILDPQRLSNEVVNQIQDGFSSMGVYYVGLFMLDEERRFATLEAATGEAAQPSLEIGYELDVDETSTVGWSIAHQQARIAQSVGEETPTQFGTLSMPHTRSEIALPLRSRGNIIGALSIQSTKETGFSDADISILQTMADQVALAIDNARLFSQTEAVLEEVQEVQRRYLTQRWEEFLAAKAVGQVEYTQPGTRPKDKSALLAAQRQAIASGQAVALDRASDQARGLTTLVVPLKLRDQVIGTMTLYDTRPQRSWNTEEIALTETVAEQTAMTIDNLRLFEETQRRAMREQLTREITDKMRRTTSIDDLMKTAIQEAASALGISSTFVQLSTAPELMDSETDDSNGKSSNE